MLVIVLAGPPESSKDGPGVADKSNGFLERSPLVAVGLDLSCQPKLALNGICDLDFGLESCM